MTSTTENYSDQLKKYSEEFRTSCSAAALFYWGDGSQTGLRVEAPEIMQEFVDKVTFGRGNSIPFICGLYADGPPDPQGLLFYNETTDFDAQSDEKISYKVFYHNEKFEGDDMLTIRVDFLVNNSSNPFTRVRLSWKLILRWANHRYLISSLQGLMSKYGIREYLNMFTYQHSEISHRHSPSQKWGGQMGFICCWNEPNKSL